MTIFAKKLLDRELFPTHVPKLKNPVGTEIAAVTTSHKFGTITESGWYRVKVGAASGGSGDSAGATGGRCEAIVYLYKGSKYLMWGASGRTTYYPKPSGTGATSDGNYGGTSGTYGKLGGGGATSVRRSGGGGGGAGGHGGGNPYRGGDGGGGSGFICGLNTYQPTESEVWNQDGLNVDNIECMVLCSGGGGGFGNDGGARTGGNGGGAWGNGGRAQGEGPLGYGGGPGGTFGMPSGVLQSGAYTGALPGAWCIRDYSTGTFTYGDGIKSGFSGSAGRVSLEKLTEGS